MESNCVTNSGFFFLLLIGDTHPVCCFFNSFNRWVLGALRFANTIISLISSFTWFGIFNTTRCCQGGVYVLTNVSDHLDQHHHIRKAEIEEYSSSGPRI